MAKYADSREQNMEIKYLHKIWSEVDKKIPLPEGLTGDALLPRLEGLEHPKPVSRKIRFSPPIFSWKSGATYAAALILIVALSSLIGRGDRTSGLIEGVIEPEAAPEVLSEGTETAPREDSADDAAVAQQDPAGTEAGDLDHGSVAVQEPSQRSEPATEQTEQAEADAPAVVEEKAAIGGQSESTLLSENETYTYTYRTNDMTDPHKAGIPLTVNIMHTSTGVLAFEIDLPEMDAIVDHFVYGETLTIAGAAAGNGVVLETYDLTHIGNPALVFTHRQTGTYLDSRLYKNVIGLFTYAASPVDPGCEVLALQGSTEDGMCIVSTIDLDTMQLEQKAFSGASDNVSVYNLNAYLQYSGEKTEENEQGLYVAHIRLNGVEIELREEPEEEE